jgi:hypothetical protein
MPEHFTDVRVHSAIYTGCPSNAGHFASVFPVLHRSDTVANLQRALNGVPPIFGVYLSEKVYYFLNVSNKHIVGSTPYHSYSTRVSASLLHFRC